MKFADVIILLKKIGSVILGLISIQLFIFTQCENQISVKNKTWKNIG